MSEPLHTATIVLQEEAQVVREEGDSPVGEQAGAQVEVLTVHKAKGLEYPIVIVADLLSDRPPASDVVVRHALTRARDHLVIPCFPDVRRSAWLDDAIAGFALDNHEAEVTWFDTRELDLGGEATPRTRADGPQRPSAAPTPRSANFGRLVHALLAQVTQADADLTTTARTLAPQFGLKEEDATAAADLASRARTIPEIAAAESADLVYRELPFAVPLGEGILATGRIDLAYRKAGEWTVIDFKTADLHDRAAVIQAHGAQLEVYSQALGTITGAPVRAALCLLRSGQLLDLGESV